MVFEIMNDRNIKRITEVSLLNGNKNCADCNEPGPEWASYNLGVFLCTTCATFHRKLGSHISKVKSLVLDTWDDDMVDKMEFMGNQTAREKFEADVPLCYRKPQPGDPLVLIEQWVRAKYERNEFTGQSRPAYLQPEVEENLWLKKRKEESYSMKIFVVSQKDFSLRIYNKEDSRDKEPKIKIPLGDLNVSLAPAKMGIDNCMQFTFINDHCTRHLYVKHEKGEPIINFYMAIRNLKLNRFCVAYPSANPSEFLPFLTNDFAIEGQLSKTGPCESDAYRKRWFTLDDRKLMYHVHPMDDYPKGEIFLGHASDGYFIQEGGQKGYKEQGFVFSLFSPDYKRTFVFSATSACERAKWIAEIQKVFERPLRPQDNQCKMALETGKKRTSRQSWFNL